MNNEEFIAKNGLDGPTHDLQTNISIKARKDADRLLAGDDYCSVCGSGPYAISKLHLIMPEENPYVQCDDGSPVRFCDECWDEENEDTKI